MPTVKYRNHFRTAFTPAFAHDVGPNPTQIIGQSLVKFYTLPRRRYTVHTNMAHLWRKKVASPGTLA